MINDCSDHLAEGGNKDAPYIATLFVTQIAIYNKEKQRTDLFYFDGASNVQKAGEVLEAKFPRATCLHGGEHVISLFFSDLAKLGPIKVRRTVSRLCLDYLSPHLLDWTRQLD